MDQKSTLPTLTVFCVGMLHTHVGARGPSQQKKKKKNLRIKHTLTVVYTLKPLLESVVDTDSWIAHHGWAVIPVILHWNPPLEVFACLVHYKVNSPWTRVYKKWFDMWATAQSFALTIWWWCLHRTHLSKVKHILEKLCVFFDCLLCGSLRLLAFAGWNCLQRGYCTKNFHVIA